MQRAVLLLSFAFFPRVWGKEMVNFQIKTWKIFLHLNSLIFVLESWTIRFEMVLNCAGETRKRDVTTMFTYSHANTPLGQSERAYYLSYFIKRVKWSPSSTGKGAWREGGGGGHDQLGYVSAFQNVLCRTVMRKYSCCWTWQEPL